MSRNFQYTKQFNFFTDKEIEEQLKKSDYKHLWVKRETSPISAIN